MRIFFNPRELPDGRSMELPGPSDIATLDDANEAFLTILRGCRHVGASGWSAFGTSSFSIAAPATGLLIHLSNASLEYVLSSTLSP